MSVYHIRSSIQSNSSANNGVESVEEGEDQDGLVVVDLNSTESEQEITVIHPASDRLSGQVIEFLFMVI